MPTANPISRSDMIHDRLHVRLLSMGAVSVAADSWTYDGMRNGYWRLYVHAQDGASLWMSDREYPIERHRVYLVPAWVKFDSRCHGTIDQLFLHFDVVGLGGPMVRRWFDRPVQLPTDPLSRQLAERITAQLFQEDRDDMTVAFAAKSLADLSLGRLFEHLGRSGINAPGDGRKLLHRLAELEPVLPALRWIDDRLSEPASNAMLAERCAMSEDHFIRTFRRCVGQTPARYALERRIAFAAERLVFSDESLKMIAAEAGFANRFHFSRVFTSIIGVPPAKYRKLGRV